MKRYAWSYDGMLAASHITEAEIQTKLEECRKGPGRQAESYEFYELVPVKVVETTTYKMVETTTYKLERKGF